MDSDNSDLPSVWYAVVGTTPEEVGAHGDQWRRSKGVDNVQRTCYMARPVTPEMWPSDSEGVEEACSIKTTKRSGLSDYFPRYERDKRGVERHVSELSGQSASVTDASKGGCSENKERIDHEGTHAGTRILRKERWLSQAVHNRPSKATSPAIPACFGEDMEVRIREALGSQKGNPLSSFLSERTSRSRRWIFLSPAKALAPGTRIKKLDKKGLAAGEKIVLRARA
ncbi:hypothetical protein BDZ89DRAFT_1039510 [Hymenopellis radicata]|nr:hypothetical protein BDZ89DRAFT_1039510 [Hymenopellis radicata]